MTDDEINDEIERRMVAELIAPRIKYLVDWAIREARDGNWEKFDDTIRRLNTPPFDKYREHLAGLMFDEQEAA